MKQVALSTKALVTLLKETQCSSADKLVIPNFTLSRSILRKKHGLATFGNNRKRALPSLIQRNTSKITYCIDVQSGINGTADTDNRTSEHQINLLSQQCFQTKKAYPRRTPYIPTSLISSASLATPLRII